MCALEINHIERNSHRLERPHGPDRHAIHGFTMPLDLAYTRASGVEIKTRAKGRAALPDADETFPLAVAAEVGDGTEGLGLEFDALRGGGGGRIPDPACVQIQ